MQCSNNTIVHLIIWLLLRFLYWLFSCCFSYVSARCCCPTYCERFSLLLLLLIAVVGWCDEWQKAGTKRPAAETRGGGSQRSTVSSINLSTKSNRNQDKMSAEYFRIGIQPAIASPSITTMFSALMLDVNSLWFITLPAGWPCQGSRGACPECMIQLNQCWPDVRPASSTLA